MDTQEISKKKSEFYNRPWFWIIVGVVIVVAISSSNNSSSSVANAPEPIVQQPETTAPVQVSSKPSSQPTPKKPIASPAVNNTPVQTTQQTYTTPSGATVNNGGSVVTAPPAPAASWHTVATFSGSADTNTNDFAIQGSKWRIDWNFSFPPNNTSYCQQYGCNIAVQIFQDDSSYVDQFLEEGQQPANGIVYEYGKPTGNMYLHVIGGNVSWTLTVEDYY